VNLTNFLIADLEQFGQALLRNEEIGERRFNFFLVLVTAVVGGLVTLHTAEIQFRGDTLQYIRSGAFAALFSFGFLTYLRMLQRNRVTDEFKETLRFIRRHLLNINGADMQYEVPRRLVPRNRNWVRGGLAETVGVMTAVLLGLFLFFTFHSLSWAIVVASVVAIVLVGFAIPREGESPMKALRKAFQKVKLHASPTGVPAQYFRAGAGAVIVNRDGDRVLALERDDFPGAWQLPQGGLEAGEEPLQAAYREVFEETGIRKEDLQYLDKGREPLVYELPACDRKPKTGRGQVQYWFLFKFRNRDDAVNLEEVQKGGEFRQYEWKPFHSLVNSVVRFREPVYRRLAEWFEDYLSESGAEYLNNEESSGST